MEYICTPFEFDLSTSESGIPLCCEQGISSGGQEVAWSFWFQSFSSKCSSHKIRDQMWCIVQVCGWRLWKIDPLSWCPRYSFQWRLVDKGWGLTEGKVHLNCLILMVFRPVWQCQVSSKADLQGWLAWTCHRLSGYQARVFPVQEGCCPPGRSRRE